VNVTSQNTQPCHPASPLSQALDMFMQRLFEQDAQLALEKLLGSPGSWAATIDPSDAAAQQARLRLLEDAYGKTVRLAANCERALRGVQVRSE
jgi:hypothetical protein